MSREEQDGSPVDLSALPVAGLRTAGAQGQGPPAQEVGGESGAGPVADPVPDGDERFGQLAAIARREAAVAGQLAALRRSRDGLAGDLAEAGHALAEIAGAAGLSRERVRRILTERERAGLARGPGASGESEARAGEGHA